MMESMPSNTLHNPIELPTALGAQLDDFRLHVGRIKLIEAVATSAAAVLILWLAVFALDRLWNTPSILRVALLGIAVVCAATVPLAIYRWIWRQRRAVTLARVLGQQMPHLGDQLLGVLELVEDPAEQARSPALCVAAIDQVARAASGRDLRAAAPVSRHGAVEHGSPVGAGDRDRAVGNLPRGGTQCRSPVFRSVATDTTLHLCGAQATARYAACSPRGAVYRASTPGAEFTVAASRG